MSEECQEETPLEFWCSNSIDLTSHGISYYCHSSPPHPLLIHYPTTICSMTNLGHLSQDILFTIHIILHLYISCVLHRSPFSPHHPLYKILNPCTLSSQQLALVNWILATSLTIILTYSRHFLPLYTLHQDNVIEVLATWLNWNAWNQIIH